MTIQGTAVTVVTGLVSLVNWLLCASTSNHWHSPDHHIWQASIPGSLLLGSIAVPIATRTYLNLAGIVLVAIIMALNLTISWCSEWIALC